MRLPYKWLAATLLASVVVWQGDARAQGFTSCPANQAECVVEWEETPGSDVPILDALLRTIENDDGRPADRVYKLKRGGFYWLTERISFDGFHLRIIGETVDEAGPEAFICGTSGDEDCGPAIVQRHGDPPDDFMFVGSGDATDVTLRNLWIMGQSGAGGLTSYGPIQFNQTGSRIVIDNVIFDRNDWMHVRVEGGNNRVYVTNSKFRNLFGPSQIWEGLGLRFTAGADSVVVENNTFMNIGFTPLQFDGAPARYVRFNHNTLVNIGREAWAGLGLPKFYYANNLIVNGFWHGQDYATYSDPEATDPYTGFFQVRTLSSEYGTNLGREIVLANNSYWRDPAFDTWYATKDPVVRPQPLVNDTTAGYFREFTAMVMQDNYIGANPNLATDFSGLIPSMIQHIDYFYFQGGGTDAPRYYFDPGRPTEPVMNIWPLPEDFTYTNPQLLTGGTDGLPVGDLNWFPEAKAQFEANRAQYVAEIEDMAVAEAIEVVARFEAEAGVLEEGAEVRTVEEFTYFFMEGSGFIEWTFDLDQAGTYGIDLHTNMGNETQRGQNVRINGVNLRNNTGFGEYYFCTAAQAGCANPLPANEWATVEIRSDGLVEGASGLDLEAGSNVVRISPSWGWQSFSGIGIVNSAGETVVELNAPDAVTSGVIPRCDFDGYCPSGFQQVALGSSGTVTINLDAPQSGNYMLMIGHSGSGSANILVDGNVAATVVLEGGDEGGDAESPRFGMSAGVRTITIAAVDGDVAIDYIQVFTVGTGTSSERETLPEGFALEQNYPNPFNPSTTINFSIGQAGPVKVTVYDVLGRRVATLVNQDLPAGVHRVTWNAVSQSGMPAASGVYLYRLEAGNVQTTRTMVLLK
jgi:hypothetical protein